MLLLTCPHCGPRDETEFTCGGEAHLARPPIDCAHEEWAEYLFYRHNPKGVAYERWCHRRGCGRWFNVARDTLRHVVVAVYAIGQAKPAAPVSAPVALIEPDLADVAQ